MISSRERVLLSGCVFALLTPRLRFAGVVSGRHASFFTPKPPYQPLGWSYRSEVEGVIQSLDRTRTGKSISIALAFALRACVRAKLCA